MTKSTGVTSYMYITPTDETPIYTGVPFAVGDVVDYVHSADANEYPDGENLDGYYYVYKGIPLENAVSGPKIATGSYTGTGTYGVSNPNSLTFDFVPKFVIMLGYIYSSGYWTQYPTQVTMSDGTIHFTKNVMNCDVLTTSYSKDPRAFDGRYVGSFYTYAKKSGDCKTIYWYSTYTDTNYIASHQMNSSSCTYYYLAIG